MLGMVHYQTTLDLYPSRSKTHSQHSMDLQWRSLLPCISELRADPARIISLGYPPHTSAANVLRTEARKNINSIPPVSTGDLFMLRKELFETIHSSRGSELFDQDEAFAALGFSTNRVIRDLATLPNHLSKQTLKNQEWVCRKHFTYGSGRSTSYSAPLSKADLKTLSPELRNALSKISDSISEYCIIAGEQQHLCGGRLIELFRSRVIHWLHDQVIEEFPHPPTRDKPENNPPWIQKFRAFLKF